MIPICKMLRNRYIMNTNLRESYRSFIKKMLFTAYKYLWILPVLIIILIIPLLMNYSLVPEYSVVYNMGWSTSLIYYPVLFFILYLLNVVILSMLYVNISLVVARFQHKFIPCIILSYIIFFSGYSAFTTYKRNFDIRSTSSYVYNISLKKGYVHNNKCNIISAPAALRFPKRVRYFLNKDNINLYSDGKNIIISNKNNNNQMYLTDINEEKTLKTQKIKLEFSKNIEIAASNITPGYTTIILKGRYEPLQNIPHSKSLKGYIFKQIDITSKSEVTEIRLYTGTMVKEPFISVDKVDNNIIIYAGK